MKLEMKLEMKMEMKMKIIMTEKEKMVRGSAVGSRTAGKVLREGKYAASAAALGVATARRPR